MAYKRLGDVLIDAGLITEDQLGHALKQQKETKRRLGDELIAEGVITEAGLIEALQMQLGVEFVDLSAIDLDPELSRVISKNVARQYNVDRSWPGTPRRAKCARAPRCTGVRRSC